MPRWFSRSKQKVQTPTRVTAAPLQHEVLAGETAEAGLFPARVASRNGAKLVRFSFKIAVISVILVVIASYAGLVEPIRQLLQPMRVNGTGTLIVSSDFTRTQVLLDGKVIGQTPYTGESIAAGRHKLTLQAADNTSKFFSEESIDILINPGNTTIVKANLGPSSSMFSFTTIVSSDRQPGDGLLIVKSLQHDVQVRIDGTIVGNAPYVTDSLGAGPHQVLVEKPGFKPVLVDITVAADKTVTIEAKLYQYQINLER